MLYTVNTNLLTSDCTVIAHVMNCFSDMDYGIASEIKDKYPMAQSMDSQLPYSPEEKLGELSFAYESDKPIIIFNLYGQYSYGRGRHLDYSAFPSSLDKMFDILLTLPDDVKKVSPGIKIGFPYLIGQKLTPYELKRSHEILEYYSHKYKKNIFLYKS